LEEENMRFAFTILVAGFLMVRAAGQGSSTNVLTPSLINQFAEEARTNNSALWAARARITAASENARTISLWRDPEVKIGGMAAETMMREEDGDIMYGIEQMLPVFGKEKAARAAAKKEVEVEEGELELRFQALRRALAEALLKAALADEILAISREDLLWLETLASAVEQRYGAGNASQVEVLRIQNERAKRGEQVRNEENNREDAYTKVNRLLNRNIYSAWASLELPPVAAALPFSDRLLDLALKFEPRLSKMRKERDSALAMVDATRKEQRPDLTAEVEARQYSRTGEARSASFFLKLTFPWANREKYRGAIRRDEAKVQEIESQIEDMSYDISSEIHHILARIDNARREALLYQHEIIPRTDLTLAGTEAGWRAGKEAFRDVIDARRMLVEARVMRARAVAEQYIALYELVLCCGLADLETIESLLLFKETQ
jgi:cobalt-zinc-cadmium efflux system outer membrane protein